MLIDPWSARTETAEDLFAKLEILSTLFAFRIANCLPLPKRKKRFTEEIQRKRKDCIIWNMGKTKTKLKLKIGGKPIGP